MNVNLAKGLIEDYLEKHKGARPTVDDVVYKYWDHEKNVASQWTFKGCEKFIEDNK